jgi:multimeric flavodoxin WrbA
VDVVIVSSILATDGNSAYIVEKLQEKYSDAKSFNLCDLEFSLTYKYSNHDEVFKPEMVEEGIRDVMGAVNDADLVIFIAPNYFNFISGTAKMFLDRFYVFLNKSKRPTFESGKKFFFILTQTSANRSSANSTIDWMKRFTGLFDMKFYGMVIPACRADSNDAAKLKYDELSMSLNMFV